MSDSDRSTITRRHVLTASLASLVAAGAAASIPATVQAEQPAPTVSLTVHTAEDDAAFATWLVGWKEKCSEARRHVERVAGEPWSEAVSRLNDAVYEEWSLEHQLHFRLLEQHFPGIAPALRMAWIHVVEEAHTLLDDPTCYDLISPPRAY